LVIKKAVMKNEMFALHLSMPPALEEEAKPPQRWQKEQDALGGKITKLKKRRTHNIDDIMKDEYGSNTNTAHIRIS